MVSISLFPFLCSSSLFLSIFLNLSFSLALSLPRSLSIFYPFPSLLLSLPFFLFLSPPPFPSVSASFLLILSPLSFCNPPPLSLFSLSLRAQVQKLQSILKPMMLRRLKEDVEKNLAPKQETIIEVSSGPPRPRTSEVVRRRANQTTCSAAAAPPGWNSGCFALSSIYKINM